MFKTPPKTPPNQYPSRSESDLRSLHVDESLQGTITQRAKRRCISEEVTQDNMDIFKSEIKVMISEFISAQNSRLDKLENHIIEIKNHYTEIKATNIDLEKSMTNISDQLLLLQQKITCLEKERNSMAARLSTLEGRVESFDRNLVKTSIELRNVPKREKETKSMLYDMINHLSRHLGIDKDLLNIRDIVRLPSKKEQSTSGLTVEFLNTLTKTKFLAAVKEFNKKNVDNKVCSTHLNIKTSQVIPIYITELLSPQMKRLFYLARNYAKMNGYTYCWTSNGRVLLKKDSTSQSIVVKSEQHLQQLSMSQNK
ncbi:unnamed protein product [Euphydryas editha]|uniref:FP protein C-terminal domain-containing protein n=1 Tax=Euphydryas editha TaxID=104508 RepID=A0AAU9UCU0_EUPED|nr:unnamed protein product [Euphydryas editha]